MIEDRKHFALKDWEKRKLADARNLLAEVAWQGDLMRPSPNGNDAILQNVTGLGAEVEGIVAQIEKLLGY